MATLERWKPSVTVAAVVEQGGRFLLVEEETREGLRLNNPAGHLELGESLLEAVERETLEETARIFSATALLGIYMARSNGNSYVRVAFCGNVGEAQPGRALDQGIVRCLWLSLDEIRASTARHRSPLLLRCVEDHVAGRRLPLSALSTDASIYR